MKKLIIAIIIFTLVLTSFPVLSAELPKIYSPSYIIVEMAEGSVLASKNTEELFKPAEFSKLMTAYIISQNLKYDTTIEVTDDIGYYNQYKNIAELKTGMKLTVKEHLLNMLLLYSDASAQLLAKKHSGSLEKFTDEMNNTAKKLGMFSTFYTSPSGYDKTGTSKTKISDQILLIKKIYKDTKLMDIFSTVLFQLTDLEGNSLTYSSRNHLISKYTYDKYNYSHANGLMASLEDDKISFAATAEQNGTTLIALAVNCKEISDMSVYRDIVNLFEYGYNNHTYKTISIEGDAVSELNVKSSFPNKILLTTDKTVKVLLPYNANLDLITFETDVPKFTQPPVKKGDKYGSIKYFYNGSFLAEADLVADKNANFNIVAHIQHSFLKFNTFPILIILIVIILILIMRSSSQKKRNRRKKKKQRIMDNIK